MTEEFVQEEEIDLSKIEPRKEYTNEFNRTVKVCDPISGELIYRYTQVFEYGEGIEDDDIAFAQKSMDNAQNGFLQGMKGSY